MYINVKAVKTFFKNQGRQIKKECLFILNCKLEEALRRAIQLTPGKGRIGTTEIVMGFGNKPSSPCKENKPLTQDAPADKVTDKVTD